MKSPGLASFEITSQASMGFERTLRYFSRSQLSSKGNKSPICMKFRSLFLETTQSIDETTGDVIPGLDAFSYVTVASLCMGVYKHAFYEACEHWKSGLWTAIHDCTSAYTHGRCTQPCNILLPPPSSSTTPPNLPDPISQAHRPRTSQPCRPHLLSYDPTLHPSPTPHPHSMQSTFNVSCQQWRSTVIKTLTRCFSWQEFLKQAR